MKSPKNIHSVHNHATQKSRHSSLLLWAVLILVMLSGLLYLGSKVKQHGFEKPREPSQNPLQHSIAATNPHLPQNISPTFEKILTALQAQKTINPVVYKTSIVLTDELIKEASRNHAALWQQGQQKLTFVKATVRAGVDLSELTEQSLSTNSPKTLHLPAARMTSTQIDNVTVYDVKTGQPSTVQLGLSLTSDQEKNIKAQVEREFCKSEVLRTATEDTQQHVIALLDAMNIAMIVRVTEPFGCLQAD